MEFTNTGFLGNMIQRYERQQYWDQLENQIDTLKNLESLKVQEQNDKISSFMATIGKLYLDYFPHHSLDYLPHHPNEAKLLVKNPASIFQEAKGLIRTNYTERLIKHLNLPLETYEEWLSICWKRTNLEACHVLFEDLIDTEDLEKVEEVMQEKATYQSIKEEDIPKNVPENFWWFQ